MLYRLGMNDSRKRPPLGQYIYEQRTRLGLSMQAAGEQAGTTGAYWSQVENGTTKLPGADLRRRIAAALGVPHIRLLVAAGELTPEEAGMPSQPDPRAQLHQDIDAVLAPVLDHPRVVEAIVENMRHTVQMWQDFSQQPPAAEPEPRRNGAAPAQSPAEGR